MNDTTPQRVLVTGGTGYLAGWTIVDLLQQGFTVRTTVRSAAREQTVRDAVAGQVDPGDRLEFATADLGAEAGWDVAVAGCDYVLHLASPLGDENLRDPDELIIPARDGALRVLRAATAAGVQRVVMTSAANTASPASYATDQVSDETLWTIDDPALPAYRRSKTIAERAAWDFMTEAAGQRFLGTGEFLWLREIAVILRDGLGESGTRVPTRQLPDLVVRVASWFDRSLGAIMPGLGRRSRHSTDKAQRVLDWRPAPRRRP